MLLAPEDWPATVMLRGSPPKRAQEHHDRQPPPAVGGSAAAGHRDVQVQAVLVAGRDLAFVTELHLGADGARHAGVADTPPRCHGAGWRPAPLADRWRRVRDARERDVAVRGDAAHPAGAGPDERPPARLRPGIRGLVERRQRRRDGERREHSEHDEGQGPGDRVHDGSAASRALSWARRVRRRRISWAMSAASQRRRSGWASQRNGRRNPKTSRWVTRVPSSVVSQVNEASNSSTSQRAGPDVGVPTTSRSPVMVNG